MFINIITWNVCYLERSRKRFLLRTFKICILQKFVVYKNGSSKRFLCQLGVRSMAAAWINLLLLLQEVLQEVLLWVGIVCS